MKKFNIKVGDRKFIVKAKDNIDAVRKLKSSLADASGERDVAFNKYYVKPGMKIWLNGKFQPIQNIEWGYKYAKVYTSSNEWYEFDVGKKVTVKDSSINDASYVDPKHYAEYGWKIEKDLYRDCYWEAVEQLAGKLKSEEEYKREIPKLARQIFEKHVKEIQAEINKLVASGRSQTSNYEKWAVEQAQNIMKKQGKDSAEKLDKLTDARVNSSEQAYALEKNARGQGGRWASVVVDTDFDDKGAYVRRMYVNTTGTWLETPQEADEYLRQLTSATKFLKENYKYIGRN